MTKNPNITHPDEALASAIRYVAHAISTDPQDKREHLRAVRLETKAGLTEIVASDGHRIAYAPVRDAVITSHEIVVPTSPKVASKIKAPKIHEFLSKRDDAPKPLDWRKVTRTRPTYVGRVARADLLAAVEACAMANAKIAELASAAHEIDRCRLESSMWAARLSVAHTRISTVGDDTADARAKNLARARADLAYHMETEPKAPKHVRLAFHHHGIWIATDEYLARIEGQDHRVERAATTIAHWNVTGEGVRKEIGIDVRYLLEAVQATEGEYITIETEDSYSPIRIRDGERWELIMPMRI